MVLDIIAGAEETEIVGTLILADITTISSDTVNLVIKDGACENETDNRQQQKAVKIIFNMI